MGVDAGSGAGIYELGCVLFDGEPILCPAYPVQPPIDIVGAGDTFLAALGTSIAGGASMETAARVASLASSVTVRKIGVTGTASRDELHANISK